MSKIKFRENFLGHFYRSSIQPRCLLNIVKLIVNLNRPYPKFPNCYLCGNTIGNSVLCSCQYCIFHSGVPIETIPWILNTKKIYELKLTKNSGNQDRHSFVFVHFQHLNKFTFLGTPLKAMTPDELLASRLVLQLIIILII